MRYRTDRTLCAHYAERLPIPKASMRTGRDLRALQLQLAAAKVMRDDHRAHGHGADFLRAYGTVKELEMRLEEKRLESVSRKT